MTSETMTIHKALAELKVMDSRIGRAISAVFVKANKNGNETIDGLKLDEYKKNMEANFQRVEDLLSRRNAMKRAVVMSNATTKINIGGTEYTVAEAIDMKNHGIAWEKRFRDALVRQLGEERKKIEDHSGDSIEKQAEKYIMSIIQSQPRDSAMSIEDDSLKKLREDYIRNNSYNLIDPNDVVKVIQQKMESIENFESEIDAALSVSNAITTVTFSYGM